MEQSTQQGDIHSRIMAALEPAEEPKQEEAPVVEDEQSIQDEPEAEAEEQEESGEEPGESSESEEADEEESGEQESDEQAITTEDLSGYLGIDEDSIVVDDDGIKIKTKIDGETGSAKLSDLVTSYQLRGHLDKQNKEVAEAKKALNEKTTELEKVTSEKVEQLETMLQLAWSEVDDQGNSAEMTELRENDPAEWTARQRDLDAKRQRLSQAYQQVQVEKQQATLGDQQKIQEHLGEESQKLMNAVDGWSDTDTAKKELTDVYSYLSSDYGFKDGDIYGTTDANGNYTKLGISDHRIVVMARKAMLYDKLQKAKPTIKKKAAKAPKIVKAGQPKQATQDSKIKQLKQNVKKSGGKGRSVAEYLLATGKV